MCGYLELWSSVAHDHHGSDGGAHEERMKRITRISKWLSPCDSVPIRAPLMQGGGAPVHARLALCFLFFFRPFRSLQNVVWGSEHAAESLSVSEASGWPGILNCSSSKYPSTSVCLHRIDCKLDAATLAFGWLLWGKRVHGNAIMVPDDYLIGFMCLSLIKFRK